MWAAKYATLKYLTKVRRLQSWFHRTCNGTHRVCCQRKVTGSVLLTPMCCSTFKPLTLLGWRQAEHLAYNNIALAVSSSFFSVAVCVLCLYNSI